MTNEMQAQYLLAIPVYRSAPKSVADIASICTRVSKAATFAAQCSDDDMRTCITEAEKLSRRVGSLVSSKFFYAMSAKECRLDRSLRQGKIGANDLATIAQVTV